MVPVQIGLPPVKQWQRRAAHLQRSVRADGPRPRRALRLPVAALLLWALLVFSAAVYEIAADAYAPRLLEVPVGLGVAGPLFYRLAGVSGFVAFAGLSVFAYGLFRALRSAPGIRPAPHPTSLTLPVRS